MRKKGEAPAFLFDVDQWLTSVKIAMMTAEQERGYLRLLLYQWKDPQCRLIDDDSILAVLSKMGEGWLNGGSTLVRSCFKAEAGFLANERLLRERERWDTWQKKSSKGGKRSVEVRREKQLVNGGSTVVQPPSQHEKEKGNKKENVKTREDGTASRAAPAVQSVEELLVGLQAEPAYTGINVRREYDKAVVWCKANHREPTKRFFVNWLNRADRSIGGGNGQANEQRIVGGAAVQPGKYDHLGSKR